MNGYLKKVMEDKNILLGLWFFVAAILLVIDHMLIPAIGGGMVGIGIGARFPNKIRSTLIGLGLGVKKNEETEETKEPV